MTSPRAKVWTNSQFTFNLATTAPVAVQTLSNLRSALDISHLVGYTIVDTHVNLHITTDESETGTGILFFSMGIGVFAGSIDVDDFPSLPLYEGDWLWYNTTVLRLPGAINTILVPEDSAVARYRSRAQRKITDIGQTVFMVITQSVSEGVDVHANVAHLVLMP